MKKLFIYLLFVSLWAAESPRAGTVRSREGERISQTAIRDIKSLEIKDLKSLRPNELRKISQDSTILKYLINKHGTLMSPAIIKWLRSSSIIFDAAKLPKGFCLSPFVTDTQEIPYQKISASSSFSYILTHGSIREDSLPSFYKVSASGQLERQTCYINKDIVNSLSESYEPQNDAFFRYLTDEQAKNHININSYHISKNGFMKAILSNGIYSYISDLQPARDGGGRTCIRTCGALSFPMQSNGLGIKVSPDGQNILDESGLATWYENNFEEGVFADCCLYKIGDQYSWYLEDGYIGAVEKDTDMSQYHPSEIYVSDENQDHGLIHLSKLHLNEDCSVLPSDITNSGKDLLLLTKDNITEDINLRLLTTGENPFDEMTTKDLTSQISKPTIDCFKKVKISDNKKIIIAQAGNTGLVVYNLDEEFRIVRSANYSTGNNIIKDFFIHQSGEYVLLNCYQNRDKNFISIIKLI